MYYGYDLEKNRKMALKFHNISDSWTPHQKESYIKHAIRESATHAKMNHRHIVKCYGSVFLDNSRFSLSLSTVKDVICLNIYDGIMGDLKNEKQSSFWHSY